MATSILSWGISFVAFLLIFLNYLNVSSQLNPIDIKKLTLFFSVFVFIQFWNLFNARCLGMKDSAFKGIFENKAFIITVVVILIGQILMVQFGGKVFRTTPLSLIEWILVIGGTSIVLWIGEIIRFVSRKK